MSRAVSSSSTSTIHRVVRSIVPPSGSRWYDALRWIQMTQNLGGVPKPSWVRDALVACAGSNKTTELTALVNVLDTLCPGVEKSEKNTQSMDQENVGQPKGENGECSTRFTSPETTLTSAVVAAAIRNVSHSTHLSRLLRVLPPSLRSKPQIFLALSERSTNPDAILRALRELREAGESPPPDSIPRILNKLPPNLWREAVEVVRTALRRSEANAPSSSSIPSTLPSNCFFPNTPLSLECFVVLLRLAARAGALSFVENLGKDLSFVNGTASLSRSEPEAIQFPEAFFSDATRSSIRTSLCVAKFTQKGLAPERSPTRLNVRRMEKTPRDARKSQCGAIAKQNNRK